MTRVLVVDDNKDAADLLSKLLMRLGAEVSVVNDGPSGLDLMRVVRPSAIFLDLGMPEMDGFEVARRVRRDPQMTGVTLIAVTGWGQEETRRRSLEAGFDQHLVKPVDFNALKTVMATLKGGS
jgi:CheY-like chemotaxis protein